MAIKTLAKDVLYRVSVQLTDAPTPADQFRRWSERELVAWLNDGQRVIATFLPTACSRVDTIQLDPGTKQNLDVIPVWRIIPEPGVAPSEQRCRMLQDVIRNMGEDGLTPGRAIRLVDRQALDMGNPDWHTETGTTVLEYAFDPRDQKLFWVTPGVPEDTPVWADISYIAIPRDVPYVEGSLGMDGDSTARISIDDAYVDMLVNYILARAQAKEAEVAGNAQLASGYAQLFMAALNANVKAATGVNPNLKVLPLSVDPPAAAS